jgi:hypothetical protein
MSQICRGSRGKGDHRGRAGAPDRHLLRHDPDLIHNRTARVDFATLDRLMQFFGTNDLDDLLEERPPEQRTSRR